MSKTEDSASVWKRIEDQPVAMMTTQDGDRLVSRPMATQSDKETGRIFFISKLSGKTDEIGSSAPVNLGYADAKDNTWLSISGTAHVSQDRAKLKELWNPWAEAWLPQGPEAADVALITVEPDEAVVWDSTSSKIVETFETLRAAVTGGPRPRIGTVEHVKM